MLATETYALIIELGLVYIVPWGITDYYAMPLGLSISVLTLTQEYSTHNYIQFELYQWLDLWQQTVNKTVKYNDW